MAAPVPPALARPARLVALLAVLAAPGCGGDEPKRPPAVGARADDEQAAIKLGFPSTATKNTIRVGGADAAADAAGVASAVFPSTSRATRPDAVVLVDDGDWQGAVAGAVLAAAPVGAALLLSEGGDLPAVTDDTLKRLSPAGSDLARRAQVIRIGERPPAPSGRRATVIRGRDPYERAAAIDRFAASAAGRPSANVAIVSGERAAYAMPAAAWAARSGDAVLLTRRDRLPPATRAALRLHDRPDIFVIGPEQAIGESVERELRRLGRVRRVEGPTPVQNAIALARYDRAGFGWGITVPGYNFTLASSERPLDAAAAAALGANGVFAPLLLTDDAERLPASLESYLLDVQPGYERDPGVGVYNRVWILGDDKAVSVEAQGRLDEITRLIEVEPERR